MPNPVVPRPLQVLAADLPAGTALGRLPPPKLVQVLAVLNPGQVVTDVVRAYASYKEIAVREATKRQAITASERVALKAIRDKRELLLTYLERSFDERRENFARLFDVVDAAIERNDAASLGHALGAVVELAKSSPFKALADLSATRAALADAGVSWEV